MRVFIYEYTCAQEPLATSLHAEGWAMLSALLEDFGHVRDVEPVALLHEGFPHKLPAGTCRLEVSGDDERSFRELARSVDYVLLIAPEFRNLLWQRCHWVEDQGGRLLGPSSAAVALAGDKLELARHLLSKGIRTPPSASEIPFESPPWVCKPRYGAGSQATFLIESIEQLSRCKEEAQAEGWQELLIQPWVPGLPASVALLIGASATIPLPPATQRLSDDGRFHYLGGRLPLPTPLAARAQRLALKAARSVPGLKGYIGVDLVLGEAADGTQDWVIEINPRLTTSYVGLRALAKTNLAEAMLQAGIGGDLPPLTWRSGDVEFDAQGNRRPA